MVTEKVALSRGSSQQGKALRAEVAYAETMSGGEELRGCSRSYLKLSEGVVVLFTIVVPDRLVVASHVREKFSLVSDFELCLGTCGKGLGQLDCSTTALLVEGDWASNIDGGCEGLGI